MASVSQQYVEQYAEYAIEQQRKYGIPASVTLAQGILESANGRSQLSRECNNHFGIKAGKTWLDAGGQFGLYTDDKPNEKFCKYASVGDSYEHHSLILKNNSRYSGCFNLAQDDYRGWCNGLQKAGYASSKQYATSLISVIERMGLTKYDRMAMERGPITTESGLKASLEQSAHYSFPVKRDEFLFVTSPYGTRNDPMNPGQKQFHKGIDIRCKSDDLLATENNGRVVKVNHNVNTGGGKSVTLEYDRPDGSKYQTTYMHLSEIVVKVGDTVNAGTKIGVSGNTGTRTTGEHLHFSVSQISADSSKRDIDPAAYLAEIAAKGNIRVTAIHNGENLLAKYADSVSPQLGTGEDLAVADIPEEEMSPDDWMKKLLSSEDSGVSMPSNDPVIEMAITMFTSLMALAVQIDGKEREEAMTLATDAAVNRRVDLTTLVPGLKSCVLNIREGQNPVLSVANDRCLFNHELTNAEMSRLSSVLNDTDMSIEAKQGRIAGIINNIVVANQMSQNFDRQVGNDQSQGMQR
ncbi:MAG TPA: glucosaminidase [Porphyromonadaceae bacterium]|nr:glucosaminidase [Porphyromonadaceae bacterium]